MNFLEQGTVYNSADWVNMTLEERDAKGVTAHHTELPSFNCPTDIQVGIVNSFYGARGNYAANAGRGLVWMDDPEWQQEKHPRDDGPAARDNLPLSSLQDFGVFFVNRGLKLSDCLDGTSNTAAVCELRKFDGEDTRGALHFGACVMYQHDYTPNSSGPDRTRWCGGNGPDGRRQAEAAGVPCGATTDWKGGWVHYARSQHVGGVNLLLLDSSVRFASENISQNLWDQLGTPYGEEVLEGPL
jgi:hypothetical protein